MTQRMMITATALLAATLAACAAPRTASTGASPSRNDLLEPKRDSFVVLSAGQPVGFQLSSLERTPDGYRLADEVRVGQAVSQLTEVEFTTERRSVKSEDVPYRIVMEYAGEGVRGSNATAAESLAVSAIDRSMSAYNVADNLVAAIVPTLSWARGTRYTISMREGRQGRITSYALLATGWERVTVPSGTYDTFRVDVAGGDLRPITLNVTTTRPHRVVRLTPSGQSIEFVLASAAARRQP